MKREMSEGEKLELISLPKFRGKPMFLRNKYNYFVQWFMARLTK
jgi:hypothetical protein